MAVDVNTQNRGAGSHYTQSMAIDMPKQLKFTSWWNEAKAEGGMVQRIMTITFNTQTGNFIVEFKGAPKVYTLSHIQVYF